MNLLESTEIKQVQVAMMSSYLKHYLKQFQIVLGFLPFAALSEQQVSDLKDKLAPYAKYSFTKKLWNDILRYQHEIKTAKSNLNIDLSTAEQIKSQFLKHNYFEVYDQALELTKACQSYLTNSKTSGKPFYNLNSIKKSGIGAFFSGGQRTGLLTTLDDDTIEKVLSVDIDKNKYTYLYPKQTPDGLELPEATNEIEYLSYMILQLKDSSKSVRLNATQFEIYSRIMSSKFNELRELVQHYVFSNNKQDIEKIKQLSTPEIRQAIVKSVQGVRYVYRGLGVEKEASEDYIIAQDRETQYISTSPHESVAERFARGIGHLQSEKDTKHSEAAIVVYDISNRDCVVFSTSIFGEAFGEKDILIDATKAEVVSVDRKFFHITPKD